MKKKFWKVLTAGALACTLMLPFAGCTSGKAVAAGPDKMPQTLSISMAQKNISLKQINVVEAGRLTNLGEDIFSRNNDETLYKDDSQNVYTFDSQRRFTFFSVSAAASKQQNFLRSQTIPSTNQQLETQIHTLLKDAVPHIAEFKAETDSTSVDPTWKFLVRKVGRGETDSIGVHYNNGSISYMDVKYYTENDEQIPEAKKKALDEQAQNALQALKKKNGADKVEISFYQYILSGKSITGTYHLKSSWNNPDAPGNPAQDVQTISFSVAK